MSEPRLLVETRGHVRVLTISNPGKRNAVHPSILLDMAKRFREFNEEGVRCIVLRGEGEAMFSSGYDIGEIPEAQGSTQKYVASNPLIIALEALENLRPPIIAFMNGDAFGAGLEIAASSDIRVAREGIKMGMPPAKLGIIYSHTGLQKFIDLIGIGFAKELFFTGRHIDAARAKEIGLLGHVLPAADAERFALEMAEEIAANAPLAVQGHRQLFQMLTHRKLPEQQYQEIVALRAMAFASEDAKEGKRAFMERRKPAFKGS